MKKAILVLLMLALCIGSAFATTYKGWTGNLIGFGEKIDFLERKEESYRIFFGKEKLDKDHVYYSDSTKNEQIDFIASLDSAESSFLTGYNGTEECYDLVILVDFKPSSCKYMFYGCTNLVSVYFGDNLDTSSVEDMESMFDYCLNLVSVYFGDNFDTSSVKNMDCMFADCTSLTSLDLSGWDTSNVTDMGMMFSGCTNLESLDLRGFNMEKVDFMPNMFYGCENLVSVYFGDNFDTSIVEDMSGMFEGCQSLTSLDLSGWDTSNVTVMYGMFYGCESLTSLNLSGWDTSIVEDMSEMFEGCQSLTSLNLSGWKIGNVTNMFSILESCTKLESLNLSNWEWSEGDPMDVESVLYACYSSLTSLDLSGWDTSNVTDMSWMFGVCSSLESLNLSGWDTSNVTDMSYVFYQCMSLTSLDLSGWDTSNVKDMEFMFALCDSLTSLNLSGWKIGNVTNMGNIMNAIFDDCWNLKSLDLSGWDTSNVTMMNEMFQFCEELESLNLSGWDTSNVTDMSFMFYQCSSLISLDLSGWDTSNVENMEAMFQYCTNLKSLDLSGWDTSNVEYMCDMFNGCSSLTSLDLSGWDTSNVTMMNDMFGWCESLTSLDLSGWDTSNVTDMYYMFNLCQNLKSLDLSGWDTNNVENMSGMFSGCSSLTSLDLSGWDTSNVTVMDAMFYGCENLTSLDLSGWDTSIVTGMSWMFEDCANLERIVLSDSFEVPVDCVTDSMFDDTGNSIYILNGSKFKEYVDQNAPSYGPRLVFVTYEGATNWYESTSAIIRDKITLLVNVGFENAEVPLHSASIEYPDYTTLEGRKTESYGNGGLPVPEPLKAPYKTGYVSFTQLEMDVAPSQMTQDIAFTYNYGENGEESWCKTFTFAEVVKKYKQQMPDTTNLMNAVLLYGRYAQEHFNPEGTADLPTEAALTAEDVSTAKANLSTVKPAKYVFKGVENSYPTSSDMSTFGLRFLGNSLVCYSDMRVRHSFAYANGISWDGYKVTCSDPNRALVLGSDVTKSGAERMYVDIGGFAPYQFNKEYTVTITNIATKDAFSITYCPRSYMAGAVQCADETKSPQSLKNLCMAATLLYAHANSYFTVPLY